MSVQNADISGKFSFDTIKDFDSHIEVSIPNYAHIWELINSLSSYFIVKNSSVYDLGCSTGLGLKMLYLSNKIENVKFIGFDISRHLLEKAATTQDYYITYEDITNKNIRFPNASLILMIFTLQFISTSDKESVLNRIYDSLINGGAFIITEKILIETGKLQEIFTFSYYDFKEKNFTKEQILNKQYDLRYIMKNNTSNELENLLNKCGFRYIEPFFQSLQFKGWLCIK